MSNQSFLVGLAIISCFYLLQQYSISNQNTQQIVQGEERRIEFFDWMRKFHKIYSSQSEMEYRYSVFSQNINYIEEYNYQNSHIELTFDNEFMDLSYDEFKQLMMKGRTRSGENVMTDKIRYLNLTDVPEQVDWRNKAISQVQNQGKCGGCWAFAATGAYEGLYGVKNSKVIDFSEQQTIDCCRINLYGCNGGDPATAFQYCLIRDGMMKEEDYPFQEQQQLHRCDYDDDLVEFYADDFAVVPPNNSVQMKMAVSLQPISVCISDSPVFQFYKKGVVLENESCGLQDDHCLVLVGYGSQEGKDFWLLKNSWGTGWGNDGYMMLKRTDEQGPGICGIAMDGSYVI